ncbi:MAG: ABC transporter substrate-binding protein [Fusobacterium perfoetens]|uniref:ABC transporter substrate-binding protein n=1 Tax=Fusobacterium perfoetens TaxID=852 RepID=UPI0023F2AFD7|nr:ABC transporter substrate-binding protein [Fusobacterium perfoetens]MCI6152350.1 ABC transporter substrate-binding protein [Fusobacterium perfoetens]MDY3236949.1 ABC transporter substrate-binding protein [Fusobacterium perfoetens]
MKMCLKKIVRNLFIGSLILLSFGCGKKEEKIEIGVTQIIEHAALDSAVEGFVEALKDNGFDETKVNFEFQNAQGDFGTAQTIAQSFTQSKKDLVLAVSTPSSQAMYNSSKDIPILITAVTDPKAVGLTGKNISGTNDMPPLDKQVQLIKTLLPNAKRIGFLYNTSEENSRVFLEKFKAITDINGLEIVEKGVTNVNEVGQALDILLENVDLLYTPSDNTITSSISLISEKAKNKNIPMITSDDVQFNAGGLATESIDFKSLGYQTGLMAVRILNGEKIENMPIEGPKDTKLMINQEIAKNLNVEIPQELLDRL